MSWLNKGIHGHHEHSSVITHISFGVTAIRARTKSKGYVKVAAVVPASEPARNLGNGVRALIERRSTTR